MDKSHTNNYQQKEEKQSDLSYRISMVMVNSNISITPIPDMTCNIQFKQSTEKIGKRGDEEHQSRKHMLTRLMSENIPVAKSFTITQESSFKLQTK